MCTPFGSINDCFAPALLQQEQPGPATTLNSLEEGRNLTKTEVTTKVLSDGSKQVKTVRHFADGSTEESTIVSATEKKSTKKEPTAPKPHPVLKSSKDRAIALITATVHKASVDSKVGIGLRAVNRNIYISSIAVGGLFSTTDLKVGQRVLSINNKDCQGMSSTEAITLVRSATGILTILATDDEIAPTAASNPVAPKQAAKSTMRAVVSESALPQSANSASTTPSTVKDEENDEVDPAEAAYLERHRTLVCLSRCVAPLTAIWFALFAYLGGFVWLVLGFIFFFIQVVLCCRLFGNTK